jgi:hypothetical protein
MHDDSHQTKGIRNHWGDLHQLDANYITEEVLRDRQRVENWFANFLQTDMQLDENILSKDEYTKALKGKRHFKDEAF